MQSCLVIKTSSLGDIYQTLPAVLQLKASHPFLKISWVVEKRCVQALEGIKEIDELIVVDFKAWKKHPFRFRKQIKSFIHLLRSRIFDLALDFQANSKSAIVLALAQAEQKRSFAHCQVSEWPHRFVKASRIESDESSALSFYRSLVVDFLDHNSEASPKVELKELQDLPSSRMIIMLGLGSNWPSKKLDSSQIKSLLETLKERHNPYFLIPSLESEKDIFEALLEGHLGKVLCLDKISDYIPYILRVDLFVGVDSSLLHLARLYKKPAVAFFGPSSSGFYGQQSDLQGTCPYNKTFKKRCPHLRRCSAPCMRTFKMDSLEKLS